MSRGIGQLQQKIIAVVNEADESLITLESLRWHFLSEPNSTIKNRLPQTLNTSIDRGVKKLAKDGLLKMESRPLANLDEWAQHYPNKTLNTEVRKLRKECLPHLVFWMRQGDGPRPKYNKIENERFAARQLSPHKKNFLQKMWSELEPILGRRYGANGSESLFLLLACGKQLFTEAKVSTSHSFSELVERCNNEQSAPKNVMNQLNMFMNQFMPEVYVDSLQFKSSIYAISNGIPKHGHFGLSFQAEDELFRTCSGILSHLPGFRAAPKARKNSVMFHEIERPQHSPILKKILDNSVFQDFRFLSAP